MEPEPVVTPTPGWANPSEGASLPTLPDQPPERRIGRAEREQAEQHLRWALSEDC